MKFTKGRLAQMTAIMLCSTMLFCGCVKNSDVVIKVNDKEITRGEYYGDFNKIKDVQFKNAPKEMRKDTGYAVLSLKERYTNEIIIKALLDEEFIKRKIEVTDQEIDAKKQQIIAQIGSEEQFNKILKENHISDEKLRSDLEKEVKMDKLVDSLGIKDATDADAQNFYNKHKESFNMPERVLASHILFETNPEAIKRQIADADKNASLSTDEIEKRVKEEVARKEALAKEVLAKAQANPKDFGRLAQEYSDDKGSAERGGDLGFVVREAVVKEFGDAVFSQKVGVVGPLVKTQFGTHIILVNDRAKAGVQPFAQVKNDVKNYLTQQKKSEAVQAFIGGLKNKARIEFIDESLNPENIEKELNEALKKQIEEQQKLNSKMKPAPEQK